MSHWTHINGTIKVSPMGRTQPEMTYILQTVLEHLPKVTGSEEDMKVYMIQERGYDMSSSCDEFDMRTDKGVKHFWNSKYGSFETQNSYMLIVRGDLRDRELEETNKEFQRWLCRLAKRVSVEDVLVRIDNDYLEKEIVINEKWGKYSDMWEDPSWAKARKDEDLEPNWCEYLMWKRWKDTPLPLELIYKYYADEEADDEFESIYRKEN